MAFAIIPLAVSAQNHVGQSVLSQHTWHRMSVAKEGIYKLDYEVLRAMNIDVENINPNEIRIFGNPAGVLPEKNSETRYDDLTEMAIFVSGAEDGRFDVGDYVLFYGQDPTCWKVEGSANMKYERLRNPYSDSTYYYICADSGVEGLRVASQPSADIEGSTNVITQFPDFACHEEELLSPYSSGRTWYGEQLTSTDSVLHFQLILPNLVKNKPIDYKLVVLGRSLNGTIHYDFWANDNHLVADGTINKLSENTNSYGIDKSRTGQLQSGSDTINFSFVLQPRVASQLLYLDYVELLCWRELKRAGDLFAFRLRPDQLNHSNSAVWVRNMSHDYQVWDVSNPLRPVVQEGVFSSDNFVFGVSGKTERRYFTFTPSAALPVVSVQSVKNQNLHAVSQADMLVITPRVFWDQAQELADFHEQSDGLHSIVADLDEIYNEFGTGTPDPSGIRDFIRMVYLRSEKQLKYVILFGKGSHDFRNIRGFGKNYVPPYQAESSLNRVASFCTDDFYAMMDDNEGVNSGGHVDLGIGRLPVATVEEAKTVLRKIYHYADLSATHGEWKTNHLYTADDNMSDFIDHAEQCCGIVSEENHAMNAQKVYLDAYQQYESPSGVVAPEANAELMRRFEKGVLAMQYHGHGGLRGLTDEKMFTSTDIPLMTNYDCMPFVLTATCEFSQFDDPAMVSSGELMFTLPTGGSIAMLTTVRPTHGDNNIRISKALMRRMYVPDGDKASRFGDIVRDAKADDGNFSTTNNTSKNISYVFFGDPALRFAAPVERIETIRLNGQNLDYEVALHAMSMVNVEGEIRKTDGSLDADFNGEVNLRFFDKESVFTTLGNEAAGVTNFSFFNDVLFQGKASVKHGKFTISFQVPRDINLQNGTPRFSYYAYDSIRQVDAIGVFEDVVLGGVDPVAIVDNEGPKIDFYWNEPSFQNGDTVAAMGVLYADLYDAQGIYHYGFSLGRDIMLNGNVQGFSNMLLNDAFEPALDDSRRGRVAVAVPELETGTYSFTLRAWDMHDNSSEAEIWFIVSDDDVFLAQVRNYPNPFTDETWITLTHHGDDGPLDVTLEVFDIMGRMISSQRQTVQVTDDKVEPIRWNVNECTGGHLRSGLYFYRLAITDANGNHRSVNQKMLIAR